MNQIKSKKSLIAKITIPVLIVAVVFVLWLVKTNQGDGTNKGAIQNNDIPLNVTQKIDLEGLKMHNLPILIDFGADSCIPCKEMAPILKELNSELQGKAIILFVDVWKNQALAEGYPVSLIPTQVLINSDGTPYMPSETLSSGIQMYSSKENDEHIFTTHEGGLTKEVILAMLKEMGLEDD